MAYIPIYVDKNDINLIKEKLNADSEIAYVIYKGKQKWSVCNVMDQLNDGEYYLWHIPGGQIKKITEGKIDILGKQFRKFFGVTGNMMEEDGWVKDPFKGWRGPHIASNKRLPFLGSEPNIIELNVRTTGNDSMNIIGISGFGWIGNRYKSIGLPASTETVKWWRRLKYWISQHSASQVPRSGSYDGPDKEAWAFPSAFAKFQNGIDRESNPF